MAALLEQNRSANTAYESAETSASSLRPSILIVDDENGPRQALRMLLKEDYSIFLAADVDEALAILEREPVALIISDVRMPRRSGVDLLREAKERCPDIQVILLTGYGQLETAVKALEYGAFTYLEKPFDNEAMLEMVRAGLEKYREEKDRRALEVLAFGANRFEILGRVVSGIMHDLGSPLTVLSSQLEILVKDPAMVGAMDRLRMMQTQVQHCNDMVRSTMNFLRRQDECFARMRLNSVIESCMEIARPLLRSARAECVIELGEDLPPIEGDMVLLRQAVLNLVSNACQAMETQDGPRTIWLRTWTDKGGVHLSVEDNGPGVPEAARARIFDTFYTTKGGKGTGLGLAVVKNVMRRHGGTVKLANGRGRGACFVLSFPIAG